MRYVLKRLRYLLSVLFVVTLLTFLLVNVLPGDIAYDIAGQEASEADVQAIREELGLDQPVLSRYIQWLGGVLTGDWGTSFRTGEPVMEAILSRFSVTFELTLIAQFFAILVAVPLGIISALRVSGKVDRGIAIGSFFFLSVPPFMMAILLIYMFGIWFKILPVTGYEPLSSGLWNNLRTFILPGLSFALGQWTVLMRVLRADMIGVLQEDYIAMARAKGLSTARILWIHALRPSSFSLVTTIGLQFGTIVSGSIIIESIFALPGVGRLLIGAVFARDFIVIQGCVTFIAIAYVFLNFTVDLCYAFLDPRIRGARAHG